MTLRQQQVINLFKQHTMRKIIILLLAAGFTSCKNNHNEYDATGTFEAVETIVPAEASGIIKDFSLEEGQVVQPGQYLGYIDSTQLYLKRSQLQAQAAALLSKRPDIATQLAALQEQLKQAEHEQKRISNMLKADAATPRQLDDANTQVALIKKQIKAQQSSLEITDQSLQQESLPIDAQIQQIDDQLAKTKIINPVAGTVITKYAEASEAATAGRPLYKVASLHTILLRAYITADQLSRVKTGQKVAVLTDNSKNTYKTYEGTIEWISSKAEFTPKTIQTKDERANLVYAIKIKVKNDGFLKIGMYADIKF